MSADPPWDGPAGMLASAFAEMAATNDLLARAPLPHDALGIIVQRARAVTAADFAAIFTIDAGGEVERFVHDGLDPHIARHLGDAPLGHGLLGALVHVAQPLRLPDVQAHATFTGWPDGHPEIRAFLGFPLRVGGTSIGSFYLARGQGKEPFSDAHVLSAAALALQATACLALALAQERHGRALQLEAREQATHGLHDDAIQTMFALGMGHHSLIERPDLPPAVREQLTEERALINALIADIRQHIDTSRQFDGGTRPDR